MKVHAHDLVTYAEEFIGTPYIYGGNSPIGWDCSGFVCEILRAFGQIGRKDYSAQALYNELSDRDLRSQLGSGALLFFGPNRQTIRHVAIAVNGEMMIESGGGDSSTLSLEKAWKQMAFVRKRPITWRSDLVAVLQVCHL